MKASERHSESSRKSSNKLAQPAIPWPHPIWHSLNIIFFCVLYPLGPRALNGLVCVDNCLVCVASISLCFPQMCSVFWPIFLVEFLVELNITLTGCVVLHCILLSVFWPIFFVEFKVEVNVTSTGCVVLRFVVCLVLCRLVLCCDLSLIC